MTAFLDSGGSAGFWLRLGVVALVVAALGLPINDLFRFLLLGVTVIAVSVGTISARLEAWAVALAIVVAAVLGQMQFPAPRVDEGQNVFIVDGGRSGALERGLPADAFRRMAAEFDARYPAAQRCEPTTPGCWRGQGFPDRTFAFSADGIYDRPAYSRRVTGIDFSDPVWARFGFINEGRYNWYGISDVRRGSRERDFWTRMLHPWRLEMPYFVMLQFPAAFAGSLLCWQGEVLWEGADERFTVWQHAQHSCRPIEAADAGRRIFGVSIAAPLSMTLQPTIAIQLRRLVEPGLALGAFAAVLMLLVRWRSRQLTLPLVLIGFSLAVVFLNDASFIGGVRPFEGGDDGLFYEGLARRMVQHVLAGDYARALEGGEPVFYYGGPGLRYLRALEHFIFGDSFLGYLLLLLTLPFLVFALFKRFFTPRAALGMTLVFIAVPVGALFGTTFFQYAKWSARGFADPAAAIAFIAGLIVLIGRTPAGPVARFAPAFAAGLLFAAALWLRPNVAPGEAVLLGGAGLAALWQGQWRRLAGLCLGFLPAFGMAAHNWYFGNAFVLFSSNATIAAVLPMPPSAYAAAAGELLRLDFGGEHIRRGVLQWLRWLAGPSESFAMVPLHAAAIAVLVRVAGARRFDPWLRLISGAALALHPVAWFYLSSDRYYYLTWFLTLLVVAVWIKDEGAALARRTSPAFCEWCARHPITRFGSRMLDRWAAFTGVASAR